MGVKERGKPDVPVPSAAAPRTGAPTGTLAPVPAAAVAAPAAPAPPPVRGNWFESMRQVLWNKWRWGALLALAVLVSRLSG